MRRGGREGRRPSRALPEVFCQEESIFEGAEILMDTSALAEPVAWSAWEIWSLEFSDCVAALGVS